jgi:hypothetical protein
MLCLKRKYRQEVETKRPRSSALLFVFKECVFAKLICKIETLLKEDGIVFTLRNSASAAEVLSIIWANSSLKFSCFNLFNGKFQIP